MQNNNENSNTPSIAENDTFNMEVNSSYINSTYSNNDTNSNTIDSSSETSTNTLTEETTTDDFNTENLYLQNDTNIIEKNNFNTSYDTNLYDQNSNNAENESYQNTNLALIPLKDRGLEYPRKGLRLSYKLSKRIRLLIYKLINKLPSFITGNYRRRINL